MVEISTEEVPVVIGFEDGTELMGLRVVQQDHFLAIWAENSLELES